MFHKFLLIVYLVMMIFQNCLNLTTVSRNDMLKKLLNAFCHLCVQIAF